MPAYAGPRNAAGQVTPDLLFRGGFGDPAKAKSFAGELDGPYLSQFLLQPTALGALQITQTYVTNQSGADFMKTPAEFLDVQNGIDTGKTLTPGAALYLHDGRGLAAYTHADVLYQAYFIAYLVLSTPNLNNNGVLWPLNPGNPYATGQPSTKTQNGFASSRSTRHRGDLGCSGRRSAQGGVVSEMVGTFATPPRIRWRNRAFDENRPARNHSGPCEQHCFELPSGPG